MRVALSHFMLYLLIHLELNKKPDVLVGCVVCCVNTSLVLAQVKQGLGSEVWSWFISHFNIW